MANRRPQENPNSDSQKEKAIGAGNLSLARIVALNFGLFAIYFLTARLGLKLGAISSFATLVWPPSGIALAFLVIFGFRLWPGVAIGAFAVNWSMGAPASVALAMSTGNTLEALVGAALLLRVGFASSLDRLRWVAAFICLAALFSPLISATIGVSALYLSGGLTASYASTWIAVARGRHGRSDRRAVPSCVRKGLAH